MNVENCPRCDRIFAKGFRDVCTACYQEIEQEYIRCAQYLRENKHVTMQELSEATEVSVVQITKFMREGRISVKHAPNMSYPCDNCGQPIHEGNRCQACQKQLLQDLQQVTEDEHHKNLRDANANNRAYKAVSQFRNPTRW